eukprot:scaffold238220_cov23-Tisochrysis_lutea.AAC.2
MKTVCAQGTAQLFSSHMAQVTWHSGTMRSHGTGTWHMAHGTGHMAQWHRSHGTDHRSYGMTA